MTYTLNVFNDIGQLVLSQTFIANAPFIAISAQNWANGLYVVQLEGNGLEEHRKWIKMASR